MTASVIRAHAASLPLPDASVHLIVTSPPYWVQRDYGYPGQLGSEATPEAWLENLLDCTREWIRVLKPDGNLFVNLGDKYSTGNSGQSGLAELGERWAGGGHSDAKAKRRSAAVAGRPPKSLLGLPWRYALGCMDRLGLILRAEIVWAKPNGLPESVTDRVRRAHEQVFHFTRQPRYYAAVDEIREPHAERTYQQAKSDARSTYERSVKLYEDRGPGFRQNYTPPPHPLGKLPGSVWSIPSQPLTVPPHLGVDHFAAFPMELPRRCILGWSPPGVCTACGQGRRPIVSKRYLSAADGYSSAGRWGLKGQPQDTPLPSRLGDGMSAIITGYACACGEDVMPDGAMARQFDAGSARHVTRPPSGGLPPAHPAVVLDPFGGTGTTALIASVLGRHGITADLSMDYARLAQWRVNDPGERARALMVPKPPPQVDGQDALFEVPR